MKKNLHLFPYHLTSVQEVHKNNFPQRTEFCQWFLGTFDDNLLQTIFFIDETWFHLNGDNLEQLQDKIRNKITEINNNADNL
ncbi:hypothetical protein BDFB_012444 [Asbolus verrucosus]|uniref:DDE 3 domain containing protein n=1 Tax=Asbolus verrucosus TaxID=1661398 RepID=A0A482VC58_ASBVE|nr:hypothetical protein BDFB_012444 [Asbolus verrucosus]